MKGHTMDFNAFPLFDMLKKRFSWLGQRQEVLSQNIANANTPKYRPRDLEAFSFEKILRREGRGFELARTHENHYDASATLGDQAFYSEKERRPFETAPDGNAVILEEQMAKIAETQAAHDMAAQLYKKYLNMFKIAIGRGR